MPPLARPVHEPIDVDEYVRVEKFALDPTGEARFREDVADVVARHQLDPKERVSWDQTRRVAATLGQANLARADVKRLHGPEMLAIRNRVATNTDVLVELDRRLAAHGAGIEGLPPEKVALYERARNALNAQNDALLHRFIVARSQMGRDLNNLKMLAQRTTDPVTWLTMAQRMLGDLPLDEGGKAAIRRLSAAGDRKGLVQLVAGLRKATLAEKATTLWKAGLLTALTTAERNIIGNTSMAALEVAKDPLAVLFDRLLGARTGLRTKTFTRRMVQESAKGARQGLNEAWQMLRHPRTPQVFADTLAKFDIPREVNFDSAILDTYTKLVFRSLGAQDRVFRGAALRRSLAEQAALLAREEGLTGTAATRRVDELLAHPTDEMSLRAVEDAEVATFNNRGKLSSVLLAGKRAAQQAHPLLGAAADVVLPFARTPANIATRIVEYSPLGALSTLPDLVHLMNKTALPATQRKVAERLARASLGSGAIVVGYLLAQRGQMTGASPTSPSARQQRELEGRVPNGIKLGNRWYGIGSLSPLGNLLALGANLFESVAKAKDEGPLAVAAAATGSGVRSLTDQPFLTGVSRAAEFAQNPNEQAGRYLSSLAGSVVPTLVAQASQASDPVRREPRGIVQGVQSRLPGAENLPARIDQFGRPVAGSGAGRLFDPFLSRDASDDPLVAEMQRVGASVGRLGRKQGEAGPDYERRARRVGERFQRDLRRLVSGGRYRGLDDAAKRDAIENLARQTRSADSRRENRTVR